MERLAIVGATGYAGGLVAERARAEGLPLRLVGRRREALEAVAHGGDETRIADARDRRALADSFSGCFADASAAGPFLEVGTAVAGAAIDAGAHYLDISADQVFKRRLEEEQG